MAVRASAHLHRDGQARVDGREEDRAEADAFPGARLQSPAEEALQLLPP